MRLDVTDVETAHDFGDALTEGFERAAKGRVWIALGAAALVGLSAGRDAALSTAPYIADVVETFCAGLVQIAVCLKLLGGRLRDLTPRTAGPLLALVAIPMLWFSLPWPTEPVLKALDGGGFGLEAALAVALLVVCFAAVIWFKIRTFCAVVTIARDDGFSYAAMVSPTMGRGWSIFWLMVVIAILVFLFVLFLWAAAGVVGLVAAMFDLRLPPTVIHSVFLPGLNAIWAMLIAALSTGAAARLVATDRARQAPVPDGAVWGR